MPCHTIVHRQDWFLEEGYRARTDREELGFLDRSFELHFNERPFLNHFSYLFITRTTKERMRQQSNFSVLCRGHILPREVRDKDGVLRFLEAVEQFERIIRDSGLVRLERLTTEEITGKGKEAGLVEKYFSLSQEDTTTLEDIRLGGAEMRVGDKRLSVHTLSEADDLPAAVRTDGRFEKYSTDRSDCRLSFAAPVGLMLPHNHICNLYVFIDDPAETLRNFEKAARNMRSLSRYSRANEINRQWTEEYLNEAHSFGLVPVRCHCNVLAWSEDRERLRNIRNDTGSALAQMGCKPRHNTVDAPTLYWAGIPGGEGDFPAEESFHTFIEQAACLFIGETNYASSLSPFGIKMADRLSGRPIHLDISDEPMKRGTTTNRNKFILGPSGSGKSFFTNHLVRNYYEQGAHILLVDTGNSIKTLILTLWKREDELPKRSEEVALSGAVNAYIRRITENPELRPDFNGFYEFVRDDYRRMMEKKRVREKDFDIDGFLNVLEPFYKGGDYDFLLNSDKEIDLTHKRFIVFELDNISSNKVLLPVVTLIIMETFISKMRRLKGIRKVILLEEAWKSLMSPNMAAYILYLFKTVRKYFGEAVVVTLEVDDIISSPIVKEAIINNSDCKILLDQRKYLNKFERIQTLLGLTDKECSQILSINRANDPSRRYKEVWIGLGGVQSAVYATETSTAEYLTYTTEESEKLEVERMAAKTGSMEQAIRILAAEKNSGKR